MSACQTLRPAVAPVGVPRIPLSPRDAPTVRRRALLPESAVQSGPEGNYVLIVGKDNKIERKPVKVGAVSDAGVSIASGLTGNERVVTLAGAFLNVGDTVKPVLQKSSQ